MALVLDGAVIVIFIVTCITGYMRGFFNCLVRMLAAVAAVGVALWGSAVLAQPVYDRYLAEDISKAVHTAAHNIDPREAVKKVLEENGTKGAVTDEDIDHAAAMDGDLAEGLRKTMEERGADTKSITESVDKLSDYLDNKIPEAIQSGMEKAGLPVTVPRIDIDRQTASDMVKKAISQGTDSAADYVVKNVVEPMAVAVIRVVVFVICFVAVSVLARIILKILGVLASSGELGAADMFGGLALGAAKGAMYCFLIAFLLCTVINATKDSLSVMNSEVTEKTYLFRFFFDYFYK